MTGPIRTDTDFCGLTRRVKPHFTKVSDRYPSNYDGNKLSSYLGLTTHKWASDRQPKMHQSTGIIGQVIPSSGFFGRTEPHTSNPGEFGVDQLNDILSKLSPIFYWNGIEVSTVGLDTPPQVPLSLTGNDSSVLVDSGSKIYITCQHKRSYRHEHYYTSKGTFLIGFNNSCTH